MKIRTLALALLATAACRSSSSPGNGNPDAPGGSGSADAPSSSDDTSIYDIQNPAIPLKVAVGAVVNVRGVVVTAIDTYGVKKGNFWVEEPGGGAYSGVLVFGADLTSVSDLNIGDLVDITGASKAEFALTSDTSGRTTTELEPPKGGALTVTKTGTGTVPDPMAVDALAIGQMAAADADNEWEKWEGVLIKVSNVSALSGVSNFASDKTDADANEFEITGGVEVESTLAAFPTTAPVFGDCESTITGVGDYFFDWLLEPRTTAEIATGGTGCPVAETGSTACHDGVDNDGNGHADCADYSCDLDATVSPSCIQAAKIHDIDTSATNAPVGGAVKLTNVCVVAIDSKGQNLWIQDAGAAAVDTGVEVFRGSKATGTAAAVGTTVNIDTTVILPFHGLMEIAAIPGATSASPNISASTGACVPAPLTTTLATLADTTMIAHYSGSLVMIPKVKITVATPAAGTKPASYTLSDGTKTLEMGVQIVDPALQASTTICYNVTGLATLDTSPNPSVPMILPRTAADLAVVSCN